MPYEKHGCDWPDWVADEVLRLRARIAEMEGLGPLIEQYSMGCVGMDNYDHGPASKYILHRDKAKESHEKIDAILKGGAK